MNRRFMQALALFSTLTILFVSCDWLEQFGWNPAPTTDTGLTVHSNPQSYHVTTSVTVTSGSEYYAPQIGIVLPLPQSSDYQDIFLTRLPDSWDADYYGPNGTIMDIPNSSDRYVRYVVQASDYVNGVVTVHLYFDATLYTNTTDFSRITTEYNYPDSTFPECRGTNGDIIDPNNSTIALLGDVIWAQSTGIMNYARNIYEWTALNLDYGYANQGLRSLIDVLQTNTGDCGNLSSVFISFLRHAGIPARHLVAIRPDGSGHAWAEFYMQDYGWIPVDVNAALIGASGDYVPPVHFGTIARNNCGIIMTRQAYMPIDFGTDNDRDGSNTENIRLLQNFAWDYPVGSFGYTPPQLWAVYSIEATPY